MEGCRILTEDPGGIREKKEGGGERVNDREREREIEREGDAESAWN